MFFVIFCLVCFCFCLVLVFSWWGVGAVRLSAEFRLSGSCQEPPLLDGQLTKPLVWILDIVVFLVCDVALLIFGCFLLQFVLNDWSGDSGVNLWHVFVVCVSCFEWGFVEGFGIWLSGHPTKKIWEIKDRTAALHSSSAGWGAFWVRWWRWVSDSR